MNQLIIATKEILSVQGIRIFLRKFKKRYFSSDDKSDIKNAILDNSKGYNIFLDIGANQGPISLPVKNNFNRVIAFEPLEKPYNIFKKIIKDKKISNITLYNLALGEKKESMSFYESPYSGQSRFNVGPEENWKEIKVEVDTLDNVLSGLGINEKCLIKIDVEGYELNVVKGAKKLLENDCVIITEFNPYLLNLNNNKPVEYIDKLKSQGYSFFDLNGKPINNNYLKKMCKLGINKPNVADDFLLKK